MKRVFLFLATNLAILLVLSVSMRVLGVEPWLNEQGLNLTALFIFAAVLGFGGSFISLAISKWTAKRAMGVQVIEAPSNATEAWPVQTVRRYANDAGIGHTVDRVIFRTESGHGPAFFLSLRRRRSVAPRGKLSSGNGAMHAGQRTL